MTLEFCGLGQSWAWSPPPHTHPQGKGPVLKGVPEVVSPLGGLRGRAGPCPTVPWAVDVRWEGWEGPHSACRVSLPSCAEQTCPHQDAKVFAGNLGPCSRRERFWLGVQRNFSHTHTPANPPTHTLGRFPLLSQAATQTYFNVKGSCSELWLSCLSVGRWPAAFT